LSKHSENKKRTNQTTITRQAKTKPSGRGGVFALGVVFSPAISSLFYFNKDFGCLNGARYRLPSSRLNLASKDHAATKEKLINTQKLAENGNKLLF